MNPKEVEKCYKCRNWIGFLENAVCVETGRMGQEWQTGYGFITNPLQKKFYHETCFYNLNENREVINKTLKDTNINSSLRPLSQKPSQWASVEASTRTCPGIELPEE